MNSLPVIVAMALEIEEQGAFEAAGVPVLYTGVGKVNATYALTRRLAALERASERRRIVLNLGTAGSSRFPIGSLVACCAFVQRDMDASALGFERSVTPFDRFEPVLRFPTMFPDLLQGVCGSGDSFATSALDGRVDVFDMEAYALARVCALEGVNFACVKFITDDADTHAAASWQENLARASREWLALYERLLRAATASSS
ncbi:MAG TPA: 5'-nucleosidase [Steroidobacter sp.]|nr:5'-nucleosidase [Steroidobacter sp.]